MIRNILAATAALSISLTGCSLAAQESRGAFILDPADNISGMLDCLEAAQRTLVAAHRGGASPGLPENAIETMDAVLASVPAIMEVDVGRTADGVHVLMHDETLDRTTSGSGRLAERDWAYVSQLRLRDRNGWVTPYQVPTLADALEWARERTVIQLDFKRSADKAEVAQLVHAAGVERRVILIAYTLEDALELHQLVPEATMSLTVERPGALEEAVAAGLPADRIIAFTGTRLARPDLYQMLDEADVEVIFGTLGRPPRSLDSVIERFGTPERYAELSEGGVDVLATDRPREAAGALAEAGRLPEVGQCGITRAAAVKARR